MIFSTCVPGCGASGPAMEPPRPPLHPTDASHLGSGPQRVDDPEAKPGCYIKSGQMETPKI